MIGVLVNTAAVLIGSLIGLFVNKGIPKRLTSAIMTGLGLCTMMIGIKGALDGENIIILVVSIALGAAAGTALKLDERLESLGMMIERRFAQGAGSGRVAGGGGAADAPPKSTIAQGFVTASMLFCIGAMAVVGSFDSVFKNDNAVVFTKSTLDLIAAVMLASGLGVGVMFSAASVLVYQGMLVLLAQLIRPLLENPSILAEMNCAGSLIIVALGLNMIGVTKIKIVDYLPAILFAPVITAIAALIAK